MIKLIIEKMLEVKNSNRTIIIIIIFFTNYLQWVKKPFKNFKNKLLLLIRNFQ